MFVKRLSFSKKVLDYLGSIADEVENLSEQNDFLHSLKCVFSSQDNKYICTKTHFIEPEDEITPRDHANLFQLKENFHDAEWLLQHQLIGADGDDEIIEMIDPIMVGLGKIEENSTTGDFQCSIDFTSKSASIECKLKQNI